MTNDRQCARRHRLFYRFRSDARRILLVWVNDNKTLRAYGSKTDAYATFKNMLDSGKPPEDFDALMQETRAEADRFEATLRAKPDGS